MIWAVDQRIPTSIPWWMGVAIFGLWLLVIAGVVVIGRHRFRTRRAGGPPSESAQPPQRPRELETGWRELPPAGPDRA